MSRYCDKDGAYHDFCPPNASLETYVNTKIPNDGFARGGFDNSLPSWMNVMVQRQEEVVSTLPAPSVASTTKTPKAKGNKNISRKSISLSNGTPSS